MIPWEEPWKAPRFAGRPFPRNFYTGKPYRGINVLLLWSSEYTGSFGAHFGDELQSKEVIRKDIERDLLKTRHWLPTPYI